MNPDLFAYYVSPIVGGALTFCGAWLLFKPRRAAGGGMQLSVPWFGKISTKSSALALTSLGAIALLAPIVKPSSARDIVMLHGKVHSNAHPVQVYAVVRTDALQEDGEFRLPVPHPEQEENTYKVIYVVHGEILEEAVDVGKMADVTVRDKEINLPGAVAYQPDVEPVPEEFR